MTGQPSIVWTPHTIDDLEDRQWWSHSRDVNGSTSTFFVEPSRAAQRVIFTRCDTRGTPTSISSFYKIFDEAGIVADPFT